MHLHTVDDNVQSHQSQTRGTQAVAEINSLNSKSLESSDSVQQNGEPGRNQDEKCDKHRSSSVRPVTRIFRFRLGRAWVVPSRICFSEVVFPHEFFCQSITKFLVINPSRCSGLLLFSNICLCLQQGAECGAAAAAFQLASFLISDLFFDFVLCDVGHFIITQSYPVNVSCWSALWVFLVSRIVLRSFLCCLCVIVF